MEVKRIPRFYWLQIRNRNAVNLLPEGKLRRKRQPNSGLEYYPFDTVFENRDAEVDQQTHSYLGEPEVGE